MFLKLSSFYFSFYITIGIYTIYLPKIMSGLNYSSYQIGVIFSIIPLTRFLIPFFFLKKFKLNNKIFIFSSALSLLASILLPFTVKYYPLLLATNLLAGIGMTIIYPYVETITMNILKEKYGRSRLFGSMGFIYISLMGAYFSSQYFLIFSIYILATLVYFLISITMLSDKDYQKDARSEEKEANTKTTLSLGRKLGFWLSVFLIQVSYGGYYNFFTIYELEHGISMEIVSYLWSFAVICEVIILYFQNIILNIGLMKVIKFSILVTVLRWFLLYAFPDVVGVSYFTQALHAISFALYYSATILYLYKVYPNNRKLAMLFLSGLSYGLGGVIGSWVAGITKGEYLFLFASIIALLGFFVLFLDSEEETARKAQKLKTI